MIVPTEQGKKYKFLDDILGLFTLKNELTTGTWKDDPGCPINIVLLATSDVAWR